MLTVGSLFSGIGGFDMGFERAGLHTKWMVEIDPDARRVLAHHWPGVTLADDVRQWPVGRRSKRVDVICGGFPCQDLSVAGKRAGLAGKRSGLFFQLMRVVDEIRPGVVVIENVPGLRSSPPKEPGRDFEAVLRAVAALRVYECGWTCLDARWFGLAQRRLRVFFVLARNDLGAGCAAEILSLASRGGRHSPPREEKEEEVAGPLGSCANGRGWNGDLDRNGAFVVGTLQAHQKKHGHAMTTQQAAESGQLVAATLRSRQANPGVNMPGRGGEDDQNLVVAAVGGNRTSGPITVATAVNACKTASGRQDFETETFITGGGGVRRLTPTECARLQGFADDWLDLEPPLSDSAKYRLLGNAVSPPVAEWLGRRIVATLGDSTP